MSMGKRSERGHEPRLLEDLGAALGLGEVGDLVVLLPLHAPILEPDLDLPLRQIQHVRYLDATSARQVAIEVELLLQFERLVAGVGCARPLAIRSIGTIYANTQT